MNLMIVIFKTLFIYVLVAIIFRVMGKREVGQLGTFDLVVFILIAELVALALEHKDGFLINLVPVIILVLLQIVIAKISLKSAKFRNFVDGKPVIIIKKGIVNFKNMVEQRYTLDDLLLQLREKDVRSLDEVDYAILETNGKLSVFKKDDKDDTIDFGDIFIAESEYDYGSGKLDNKDELKKEYKGIECNFELKTKMNTFIEEKHPETLINAALESKNLNLMRKNPLIHFKPGACGSYVVANQDFMNKLIETNRKLRGLDMEGYGLYMASHILGKKSLMIKCVSDFADSNKGDKYHKMCSYSSAWFLFEYLKYTY